MGQKWEKAHRVALCLRLEFGTKYCQHSPTLDEGKLHSAILAAMNEYAAIRQEVCPDVLTMAEEARQALSQAGARLLQLKKRMDAVSREQSDVLDRLLVNMADTELNARMKALTDEKESLKAQIADAQQAEVNLEEQAARRGRCGTVSWNAPRATRNLTMSSSAGHPKDHGGGCGNHPHPLPRLGCGAGTGSRMNRKEEKKWPFL